MGILERITRGISNLRAKTFVGIMDGGLPAVTRKFWGANDFLTANEVSLYVNRAIAKRAEKVGEVEFILKNAKGEIVDQPNDLLNLLYKPNKVFTGRQFWGLAQKYYDLTGEVYIYIERDRQIFEKSKIVGLHLLQSNLVEPKFNKDGTVEKYEYKPGSDTIKYEPTDILYLHNPDPRRPLRGQSLLKAGIAAIQTETQISTYHSRVLENGGKVEGVFSFKMPSMTQQQLTELKEGYKKEYAGAKKAGIPLFLGGEAEYINTGLTPSELSYIEAKKMTLEDICILTGVPKAVLGSMDDVQFSNADASIRIFLRETIRPLLRSLTSSLDEVLFPQELTLDFVDPTPENVDERLKETESGIKNYYMTINEARERHGLDPIAGADDILIPFSVMPLGADTSTESAGAKRMQRRKTMHPLADPEVRKVYASMQVKRMDNREKKFKKTLKEYLNGQRDRIIEGLGGDKAVTKTSIDELLRIGIEVKLGKDLFIPVLTDLLKSAGIDAMEFAGSEYAFNITAGISGWIENRADKFLTSINETTLKDLQAAFSDSLEAGEPRDALVRRIEDVYGDIATSRAVTIARTEVHNSTQFGTMEGYKQAGLTTKIWVAVLDTETRADHAYQDGEERPIDTPFSNGLMFPGDPAGAPEDVINCRCVI